jgi:hypothetical protein
MLKRMLFRGLQGSIIGVFIIQFIGVFMMLYSAESTMHSSEFLINQNISGATIGFVFGALNILFVNDKIGLLVATVLHFLGVSIVFTLCSEFADWNINLPLAGTIFIITYLNIWLVCYLHWKKSINAINKKLNNI